MSTYLPIWVNRDIWKRMDLTARWNQMQVMNIWSGAKTAGSSMALMRGLPSKPPAFVILEKWNKISPKMRLRSGLKLEQRAAKSYAAEEQKQFARALAIKNCAHEFATIKPEDRSRMTTQACVKCGYVENLPLQTHAA